ncbi:sigma-70 family RNA polymerase sigma factor [Lysinibacillus sp. NPDC097287]|uniref:sigma-70 family RNA polymerase sigma factor n=1 Tax=Lysinibacillus sp. NPDC097287 TaxID=3364144 RepID=UPI00380D419F
MDDLTLSLENAQVHNIDEIMQAYGQELLQLVYAYVKNQAIAEDLTQEIFVKCYQALPTYKGNSTVKTWLWRIGINHCKDYLKSWYNQNVLTCTDEQFSCQESNDDVEQIVIQQDEDSRLAENVMQLPLMTVLLVEESNRDGTHFGCRHVHACSDESRFFQENS